MSDVVTRKKKRWINTTGTIILVNFCTKRIYYLHYHKCQVITKILNKDKSANLYEIDLLLKKC